MEVTAFKQAGITVQSKQHITVFLVFSVQLCISETPVPNCESQSTLTTDPQYFVTPLVDTQFNKHLLNYQSIFMTGFLARNMKKRRKEKNSGKYSSQFGYTQHSEIPRLTCSKRISYSDAHKHKRWGRNVSYQRIHTHAHTNHAPQQPKRDLSPDCWNQTFQWLSVGFPWLFHVQK